MNDYPQDWRTIATAVKAAADWRCIRCDHADDRDAGRMLTVHHLDLDKAHCAWWNLVALCQTCHLSVQARVVLERPYFLEHADWFKPYVAAFYAVTIAGEELVGIPGTELAELERRNVERRLDELLDLGRVA